MIEEEEFTKRKENPRKKKRNREQRSPGESERALKLHHRSNLSEKENEPQKTSVIIEDFTMADSGVKRKEKQTKKKRKQRSPGESERPIKLHLRINSSEKENEPQEQQVDNRPWLRHCKQELEERGGQWRNLELIISIDKRELDLHKKVKLVHGFVMSRVKEEDRFSDQDNEVVNISRLVTFINDWIESLLISEGKQVQSGGEEHQAQVIEMFLDLRCWEIFKFCLEESLKLNVSLNISLNLLRSICFIARNALSLLNKASSCPKDLFSIGEGLQLYNTVLDCVSLVFSSYEGFLNENLDLWLSLVGAVLDLVHKSYIKNIVSGDLGSFVFRFSCLVLGPFAMFLRARQPRKDEFRDFVNKLLEPLLHLLGLLHLHIHGSDPDPGWRRNLLKLVEEVLSHGLYHTKHIDGILKLCPTEKYTTSNHGKSRDSKEIMRSYHRHLFDKLEGILAAKNALAVESIGELFRLLVDQVKNVKKASMLPEDTKVMGHTSKMSSGSSIIEKSYCSTGVNTQARKSLHNFFVLIMEPLLLQINGYLETKLEVGPALLHVHSTLKSVNNVLSAFMHEKVYMRTEDTSEGACLNFLKKVYIIITSLSSNLIQLSKHGVVDSIYMGTLTSIASEVLSAVGYLLEIEYEVIENDLVSLWLMILSYLAIESSLVDFPNGCSLSFKITDIGCQLITLYSQLRQVNSVIFALCKALRLLNLHNSDGEINYTRFVIPLNCKAYAQSVEKLLCAQEFKIAIQTAMKFMPEGQVTGCIRQLTLDVSECLEWMKISYSKADEKEFSQWQAELLGRGLSEIYALVLQSLIVTPGNSILLGASIKDLITVICPCMHSLVGQQPDVNKFLCSITGNGSYNEIAGNENISLIFGPSTYWVFVFFFQLYTSCRSLYREARILVPPELSRNMSAAMGDSFSGRDWMEMTEWINEGFFSWIIQPSASLLVVIESISLVHCKEPAADSCPLTYVMHTMACERLVDLKSRIKSFEYAMENSDNLVQVRSHDVDGLSQCRKRSTEVLRQEAKGLTGFMMEHLSLVFEDQQLFFTSADTTYNSMIAYESDEWDFSVCAVNKKSLPTAIWWIVCQNIDTWCPHATQEYLEMFLSILFHTTLPGSSSGVVRQHKYHEADRLKKVTLHQISSQCFIDSILYEQRFVLSDYFASTFCHALEESTLPFISDISAGNVDLKSSPDWQKVLTALENSSVVVSCNKTNIFDCSSATKPANHASVLSESCKEQKTLPSTIMKYTACQSLLSLLSHMPKGHLSSSSFTLYVTSILNLERIVVGGLLDYQNELYPNYYFELFSLFVSCRKSLKCVIMACDEKTVSNQTSETPLFFGDSFFVLWLYKSVHAVVGLQELFSKDNSCSVDDMIFSLMDHTFYVYLTSNKYEPNHGELNAGFAHGQKYSMESDPCLDSSNSIQAWKSVTVVAKSLKEQMQNLLVNLKDGLCNGKVRIGVDILSLNKFSSITSCCSGFLWGLARVIHTDGRNRDHKANLSRWKLEPCSELNRCIDVFAQFSSLLLQMVFFDNNQQSRTLNDAQNLQKLVDNVDAEEFLPEDNGADTDISCGGMQDKSAAAMTCTTLSDIQDDSITDRVHTKRVHLKDANFIVRDLTAVDSFELQSLNKPLLRSLLNGDYPDTAFLLRQLLIAASAVLRLNSHINIAPLSSSLVHKFTSITQVLLLESVDMSQVPHFCHFVCLDGVLKYLEELAYHFPLTDPTFSTNFYVKIVQLQLRAIGKCITLQGKRATLASHESQSSTKMPHSPMGVSEASLSGWPCLQDEFKARLRSSFAVFIKKSTEPHLLSVVTAIKKALDGVQEGLTVSYVPADRGKVSSTVAAGIDCLDLLLEFVSGRDCLGVIKRHIQSFLARMFDVILHLQSPLIFYDGFTQSKGDSDPDPGAVILMCVDVLARITGKHAMYKMKPWHLARCLLIPSSLFQDFHLLRPSESPSPNDSSNIPNNQVSDPVASIHFSGIDRQYSLDLFAACCRLLHNVLKHHKSECQRCIYLLQASVCVLLHCLETLDVAVAMEGFFSWEVEEGVKCACSLRRIYEELRHQKDVFGPYCFQFLSDYIFVYSGYGPRKTGIKREINEALRPGVYALMDVCSVDDLQRLHAWFGEGPCRNTLATLKHDYEFNFKYQGKV